MSDETKAVGGFRREPDPEERAIFEALARMAGDDAPSSELGEPSPADEDQIRDYVELLGLLPYELEPATPRPETRAEIFTRLGEASAPAPKAAPKPVAAAPRAAVAWVPYALAAALAFCLLGVGYLMGKIDQQSTVIARLEGGLERPSAPELAALQAELDAMERHFHMVTAVARHAYPMKSVRPAAGGGPLDGVVYVCGHHQRWYLNVQGLEQAPPGRQYNLWFLTDGGAVDGGVVRVGDDGVTEMEAQSLPDGTHGFAVTLEDAEAAPLDEPAGTMVLLAEESVSL